MFHLLGSCTDLPGQDRGQEGVVAGDSSNSSVYEAETNSRRRICAHPQRQCVRYFARKGKREGFTTKPVSKGILEGGVLCSYTEHGVENGG